MCITHLIIISEMLFFSCPFYMCRNWGQGIMFLFQGRAYSWWVAKVGTQTSDSGSALFLCPVTAWGLCTVCLTPGIWKRYLFSCSADISFCFFAILTTPWCSVHFRRIGFQPAPHLQDPTTLPFLFASPQLMYVVPKSPGLLLFSVQAALQSFPAATRIPVAGKQSSFRNVSRFCWFLRLKTFFFIHAEIQAFESFHKIYTLGHIIIPFF